MQLSKKTFGLTVNSGSIITDGVVRKIGDVNFHHAQGKTLAGRHVRSLRIASDNQSVVLKSSDSAVALNADDAELAFIAFLTARGYNVTENTNSDGGHKA